MSDHHTLLPANATALERAIEAAQARLSDVPVPVDVLWDPQGCPAEMLPWLAWAWSVDEWDAGWPEEIKRRVLAAAPDVHRLKGTRAAVERSLEAIGVFADIVEWWQRSPKGQPGTFSVTAWVNVQLEAGGAVLTERVQQQIGNIIRRAKPVSRAYEYVVGVLFGDDAGLACAAAGLGVDKRPLHAIRDVTLPAVRDAAASAAAIMETDRRVIEAGRDVSLPSAQARTACAAAALVVDRRNARAARDLRLSSAAGAANTAAGMQIMKLTMEAA